MEVRTLAAITKTNNRMQYSTLVHTRTGNHYKWLQLFLAHSVMENRKRWPDKNLAHIQLCVHYSPFIWEKKSHAFVIVYTYSVAFFHEELF